MTLDLDRHAGLDSPLHRWEARARLVGLGGLIVGFAWVQHPLLLAPMVAVAGTLLLVSRLPLGFVALRLRGPFLFVLAMGLVLPLVVGSTVLWQWGPLAVHREGLVQMGVIVTKLVTIASTGLVLFATAPLPVTVAAMRRLGLPAILADMTVFSYRYLHEIGDDLRAMRLAAGLRGFAPRADGGGALARLPVLASLVGSLFVTSHARAEQVHRAMVLRGYCLVGQDARAWPASAGRRLDGASAAAAVLLALLGLAFAIAEWRLQVGAGWAR
jgi:cobalt/nickel transport system permease protein